MKLVLGYWKIKEIPVHVINICMIAASSYIGLYLRLNIFRHIFAKGLGFINLCISVSLNFLLPGGKIHLCFFTGSLFCFSHSFNSFGFPGLWINVFALYYTFIFSAWQFSYIALAIFFSTLIVLRYLLPSL